MCSSPEQRLSFQLCGRNAAMPRQRPNDRTATRWTIRIIPFFIFGCLALAKYAVIAHLCGAFPVQQARVSRTMLTLCLCSQLSLPAEEATWNGHRAHCALLLLLLSNRRGVPPHLHHGTSQSRRSALQRPSASRPRPTQDPAKTRERRPRGAARMAAG